MNGSATTQAAAPRVMLIHALAESVAPIHAAFRAGWPEAEIHDLLDTSLSADLAAQGGRLDQAIVERFTTLGRYAADAGPGARRADGILFTCSAFGPAIDAVREALSIPVLKPNETAFEAAIRRGGKAVLLVTFSPALEPMMRELEATRRAFGSDAAIDGRLVEGALDALRSGQPDVHDALIADAAAAAEATTIVLGQFSMARAAAGARARASAEILTTPDSAVAGIRRAVEAVQSRPGT